MRYYFNFIFSWTGVVVSVMLYYCILCVALLMDWFVLCIACLTVCELFGGNNSQYFWACLLFCW